MMLQDAGSLPALQFFSVGFGKQLPILYYRHVLLILSSVLFNEKQNIYYFWGEG
jgi:hypothetical protein